MQDFIQASLTTGNEIEFEQIKADLWHLRIILKS